MNKEKTIVAPCNGTIIKMAKVQDQVFSQKLMGDGFAIVPSDGKFVAPVSGELVTVFDTKHAYGIKNQNVEVLLHIGLDTVELNGKGFDCKVNQGANITTGDRLVDVNIEAIASEAKSLETPVVITNKAEFKFLKEEGEVKAGEPILEIK